MTEAKHAMPGDTSFRASILRNLGGGIALIMATASVFWAIGMVGREVPDAPASGGQQAVSPSDDVEQPPQPPDDGGDEEADPGIVTDEVPVDDTPPDDEPTPDSGTPPDEDEPEETQPDEPSPEPQPADEPSIDPTTVSVQVLDGYQADGGTAANGVTGQLRDAGYRVVAENPAILYDVTAVLYTDGNEAAARQIATEIGAAEVREQPGNLSTQVAVHVVVGADRG